MKVIKKSGPVELVERKLPEGDTVYDILVRIEDCGYNRYLKVEALNSRKANDIYDALAMPDNVVDSSIE
jgi:hypothetical protein